MSAVQRLASIAEIHTATSTRLLISDENPRPERTSGKWSLGRVTPAVLMGWILLDIGLRFAPLGWLNLEPAQAATRVPSRWAPFIPNLHVEMNPWIGELALMANLQPTEMRGPMHFTTDTLGFRNISSPGARGPGVLVIEGDSNTYGAALSDDETFPAVLSQQLGVQVYNAGRYASDPDRLIEVDWLLARMKARPSAVIYVLLEIALPSLKKQHDSKVIDRAGRTFLGAERYTTVKDELRYAKRFVELWGRISPLKIIATRAYKSLCNDRFLPNSYRKNVVERKLPNNQRFLLDHDHLANYINPPTEQDARDAADYLAWLRDQFANRKIEFWVLMVPEAVSVYGHWLLKDDAEQAKRDARIPYFDKVERALTQKNVRVVNGLTVLSSYAFNDVASGRLTYYREDHHWNVLGVRRVAYAMAAAMRQAGMPDQIAQQPSTATAKYNNHAF